MRQILSTEVIDVKAEGIWRSFLETGDPVCYLLAKRIERQPRRDGQKKSGRRREPRPED